MKHVKTKRVMKDTVCGYTRVHIKVVIYEVFYKDNTIELLRSFFVR